MNVKLIALAGVLADMVSFGTVPMTENILLNGRLEADQVDFPRYWSKRNGGRIAYTSEEGPDGLGAIRFVASGAGDNFECEQRGLETASNGLYRLTFRCRGTNARFAWGQVGIACGAWEKFDGIDLPKGTYGWKTFDKVIMAIDHPKANNHFLVLHAQKMTAGTLEFADLSLTPADERTAEGTELSSLVSATKKLRVVPFAPRLDEISRTKRLIEFRTYGLLPKGVETQNVEIVFDFGSGEKTSCPFALGPCRVMVPKGLEKGEATVAVVKRTDRKAIFSRVYEYALLPDVPKPVEGRRLNNLCTELVRETCDAGKRRFRLDSLKQGWHYISAPGTATLDGREILDPTFPRHETFRFLPAGKHDLTVDLPQGGEVIVRRIAEIICYVLGCPDGLLPKGVDWNMDYFTKNVVGGLTTPSHPRLGCDEEQQLRRWGMALVPQQRTTGLADDDDLRRRLSECWGFKPQYDGVLMDEQYLGEGTVMNRFAEGLWRFKDPIPGRNRPALTYIVGNPTLDGVAQDVLSAAVNTTHGQGRLVHELYCPSRATETEAAAYIASRIRETVGKYDAYCPRVKPRLNLLLGPFTLPTYYSTWGHPDMDYRYYLDMQWHFLVNDPSCDGLGGSGYWGAFFADEEMFRWCFLLTRHYVIEGRTDRLSAKYGFAFKGLAKDGDFLQGFKYWRSSEGVTTETIAHLGDGGNARWGAEEGLGDSCVVFPPKKAGRESMVTQRVTGLEPGCEYRLVFCTFDRDDVAKLVNNPYPHGAVATFGDAVRNEALSYMNACPKRPTLRFHENFHNIIFRAERPAVDVSISNAEAKEGARIGVHFVSVTPRLVTGCD